jgi:hypothetical protein
MALPPVLAFLAGLLRARRNREAASGLDEDEGAWRARADEDEELDELDEEEEEGG